MTRTQHIPVSRKWLAESNDRDEESDEKQSDEYNEAIYHLSKGLLNFEYVEVQEQDRQLDGSGGEEP